MIIDDLGIKEYNEMTDNSEDETVYVAPNVAIWTISFNMVIDVLLIMNLKTANSETRQKVYLF